MKKLLILSTFFLICISAYSTDVQVTGNYKLTAHFNNGTPYSGTFNIAIFEKGIVIKGAISGFFDILSETKECVKFTKNDFSIIISFCTDGNVSMDDFRIGTNMSGDEIFLRGIKVTRIH